MTVLDVHYEALQNCRKATDLVISGLQFSATKAAPATGLNEMGGISFFGQLPSSSALVEAVNQVETTVDGEFAAAREKVGAVGRALTTVENNIRAAEKANGGPA